MEKKKKIRSHRCDINRPRSRYGHRYSKASHYDNDNT